MLNSKCVFSSRLVVVSALIAGLTCATGCSGRRGTGSLVAPTDADARTRTTRLLEAALAKDPAAVAAGLCAGLREHAAELLGPGQPLAIEGYSVTAVTPAWQGAEPVFQVAVSLTRGGAEVQRALRLRAREGCVDQVLDQVPVGARPRDPGAISL